MLSHYTFCRITVFYSNNYITLRLSLINEKYMSNLNRLKVVLVEQNKTGKWLAEQLGKSTCTISKWCKNTVQPDLQTLDRIAKLLNIDVKDLLNPTEQFQLSENKKLQDGTK